MIVVNSAESLTRHSRSIWSEDEGAAIRNLLRQPRILERMAASLAPSIHGHEVPARCACLSGCHISPVGHRTPSVAFKHNCLITLPFVQCLPSGHAHRVVVGWLLGGIMAQSSAGVRSKIDMPVPYTISLSVCMTGM
jgi:hypothetical protein